jgi:hypothetical protein
LVFSTLHTNSAPESITRLLDMGMDPFNFADALLGTFSIEYERTTGAELLENVRKCVEWFRATSLKLAADMPDAPAEKP